MGRSAAKTRRINDLRRAGITRVEALRSIADLNVIVAGLRQGLGDNSWEVVAKAAEIAAELSVTATIPDLLMAYDRLFADDGDEDGDPRVLGRQAIAQGLKSLDFRDPAPFERGLACFAVSWNVDHAAELRSACAHALVACDMDGLTRFQILVDHLVDPDRNVRREVVRAIAQLGGTDSVLVLRLKALTGDSDEEVLGECFASLLALDSREAVKFVERFLAVSNSQIVFEAINALAGSRCAAAFEILRRLWSTNEAVDVRRGLLFSCAASPLEESCEFLLSVLATSRGEIAQWALSALASSRFRKNVKSRVHDVIQASGDAMLIASYEREFT